MDAREKIKNYLDELAEKDLMFAVVYGNPKKNLDDCMKYILSQAQKVATSMSGGKGCVIDDDEVYGWAVHYYQEENVDTPTNTNVKAAVKTMPTKKTRTKKSEPKVDSPMEVSFEVPIFEI